MLRWVRALLWVGSLGGTGLSLLLASAVVPAAVLRAGWAALVAAVQLSGPTLVALAFGPWFSAWRAAAVVRERITTLGKKLDPSDFERVLLKIPNLRHGCFSVFGVDDAQLGTQRVVVVTEVREATSPPHREVLNDIRSQIYQQLGVKVYDILLVPKGTLTKTSSGKRRHRYFRQLYLRGELQPLRLAHTEKDDLPPHLDKGD